MQSFRRLITRQAERSCSPDTTMTTSSRRFQRDQEGSYRAALPRTNPIDQRAFVPFGNPNLSLLMPEFPPSVSPLKSFLLEVVARAAVTY